MAKTDPAQALLKRLQKLEKAYAQLGVLSTRIRAQADVISDLVSLAGVLATDGFRPAPAGTRVPATAKRTVAPRTARNAKPGGRATIARRASPGAAGATAPGTAKRASPHRAAPTAAKRPRAAAGRRARPASAGDAAAPSS